MKSGIVHTKDGYYGQYLKSLKFFLNTVDFQVSTAYNNNISNDYYF